MRIDDHVSDEVLICQFLSRHLDDSEIQSIRRRLDRSSDRRKLDLWFKLVPDSKLDRSQPNVTNMKRLESEVWRSFMDAFDSLCRHVATLE